jgi:hypothetical protein
MKIINTSAELLSAYHNGGFSLPLWEAYMDKYVPGAKELCLEDMDSVIKAGYSWENDFLPVLNAVIQDTGKRAEAIQSFKTITEQLEEKIRSRFGRVPEADIILYLGLCSGAGWVTPVNGRTTILLGIEKIMELNWCDVNAMTGLIVHEMGHVYQAQYGVLDRKPETTPDQFIWQLFTEGIAMVFEQEVTGDPEYFHQDTSEWKSWCDRNAERIRQAFSDDLKTMTPDNQRYFGDWVSFEGRGDTGYYLGARFVRFLLKADDFDNIINYDIPAVKEGFRRFLKIPL